MNVVHEDVKQCVENELQHAVSVFGLHHSWHEKYAVTLEEVQECVDEAGRMRSFLESVFDQIKDNKPDKAEHLIRFVEDHAIRCAIEAIQVAAMCRKEIAEQAQDAHPVKRGKWEWEPGYVGTTARCSVCGLSPRGFYSLPKNQIGRLPEYEFCPKCGARMEAEEDGTRD